MWAFQTRCLVSAETAPETPIALEATCGAAAAAAAAAAATRRAAPRKFSDLEEGKRNSTPASLSTATHSKFETCSAVRKFGTAGGVWRAPPNSAKQRNVRLQVRVQQQILGARRGFAGRACGCGGHRRHAALPRPLCQRAAGTLAAGLAAGARGAAPRREPARRAHAATAEAGAARLAAHPRPDRQPTGGFPAAAAAPAPTHRAARSPATAARAAIGAERAGEPRGVRRLVQQPRCRAAARRARPAEAA
eukprot:scaffold37342_cov63-Phaeocystis_antarctica.AAC.1